MKIRSDLEGVVYVQSEGGVVCLEAGDTVPDGVDVGEHLTTEPEDLNSSDSSDSDSDGADVDDDTADDDSDSDNDADEDSDKPDTEDDDQPDADGSPEDLEKGTEHARGRRGRRSTPGPGSDG